MAIEYLDGRRFRRAVVSGADWVRHRRDYLNAINVFPVPDGDTGTNMALSLSATAAAVRALDERHLGVVATEVAEASILGAKGNSGVILAHWFLGLSRALADEPRVAARALAVALGSATRSVYQALERPVEGTIITVMRAVSERAEIDGEGADVGALLGSMVESGREALALTTEQLEALRAAGVVDAGAQGFVDFLEGALRALRGEPPPVDEEAITGASFDHPAHDGVEDVTERFCTEVVVRGKGFEEERLRRVFRGMGSALLVITTGKVFKLHVHTNHPDAVIREAARLGDVEERKVDDMLRQRDERARRRVVPIVPLERQEPGVAVVSDSTADLPQAIRESLGIEMAPLQVLFGDRVYRDQVDLETEAFYEMLERDPAHPTTSQPPPRAFVEALDRVRKDREVLVITLSAGLSGTYKSALAGARLATHPRVEVFDSDSVSLGLGMMAANAARLSSMGMTLDAMVEWLERWRADTGMVFALETLEFLRRGGRIGAARGLIGRLLGVRPILTLGPAGVEPIGRARSAEDAYAQTVRAVEERLPEGERVRLGLIEIGDCAQLDELEVRLRERCDVVECIRGAPTGVIGAHAGPGAWGVFFQRVRGDDPLLEG